MPSTRLLLPAVAVLSVAFLVSCGSSTNHAVPPPTGAFSNSNLNGTYVFSLVGADSSSNFVAITGTFTANGVGGGGGITGGAIDINGTSFSSAVINSPITGGSYLVTADGRGQATLTTATPFGSFLKIDFVLTSSEHGLVTEFDPFGSGSGSLDLQTSAGQPAAGRYVFGLSGISGVGNNGGGIPAAAAGALTIDANGAATGSFDYNDNEQVTLFTLGAGSALNAGTSPGTATLVTSSGTFNFDVYGIDATHMKLIETDGFPILAGDLFVQTSSAFPSGSLAFTMAGFDYPASAPLVVGGLMTSDGTSTITAGAEDYNDGGTTDSSPLAFTGTITAANGRYELQLDNFENGQNGATGTFTFAAYPSSGGIQLVEIDSLGVTSGVAFVQTATALAAQQGYGMNLTAVNTSGLEEDDIAEFTTTSTGFKGLIDVNDQGQTLFNQKFNGTYTPDAGNVGSGVISANVFTGVYYTVNASDALFIELDSSQLGLGRLQLQDASAKSNLAAAHLAMLRGSAAATARKKVLRSR